MLLRRPVQLSPTSRDKSPARRSLAVVLPVLLAGVTVLGSGADALATGLTVPPSAPQNVAASQTGPNQATITWGAPASQGGAAITGYGVGLATANQGNGFPYPATARSATFKNLVVGITYTLSVAAENSAGAGPRVFREVIVTAGAASWTIKDAQTVDGGGPSATSAVGGSYLTSSATGEGALRLGWYAAPPTGTPALRIGARYFDLFAAHGSALSGVTATVCPATPADGLSWFDPASGTWKAVRPVTYARGCAALSLSSSSSPTISQLTGTVFGVVPSSSVPVLSETNQHGVVNLTVTAPAGADTNALVSFTLRSGLTHRLFPLGTGRINAKGIASLGLTVAPGRHLYVFATVNRGTGHPLLTTNAIAFAVNA